MTNFASDRKAALLSEVFIITTPKGGAGKTETADVLEACTTLGGSSCALVDVDDGNRGLTRRVGKENIIKLEWSTSAAAAPDWVARHAAQWGSMIFDLGAGIDSSDLPVMSFLGSTWRILADQGARVTVCTVVSTNAPTSAFIDRVQARYGSLGKVLVVFNNQDGSKGFPSEIDALPNDKLHLDQLPAGIQSVRMSRRERLSTIITSPQPDFAIAGSMMAKRILNFATQPAMAHMVNAEALATLNKISAEAPQRLQYVIGSLAQASDAVISQSVHLKRAELALLHRNLDDLQILTAAHEFRRQQDAWDTLMRTK